jgi:aryl-alcohol dehydrogenase-like predicted oxidoreductase
MDRRDFLRKGSAAASLAAASRKILEPLSAEGKDAAEGKAPTQPIPKRRLGKTGVDLSIIALGGVVLMDTEQSFANHLVTEAFDRGINYFDVAPEYGNAQERLGPALEPYRQRVFLACKTLERTKAGAAAELEQSLKLLRTDHVDLYQLHALTKMEDLEKALGPGGAMETFVAARQAGKLRFIGFSAHSVETALAALDRFDFDTILFPTNFVLFSQANFGPQVHARAREKHMGILALKAMAKTHWPASMKESERPNPKCWYQPCAMPEEAALALRWTLSQPITAAVPPGDEKLFRLAMDVAQHFEPLRTEEEKALMARAAGVEPLFKLASA